MNLSGLFYDWNLPEIAEPEQFRLRLYSVDAAEIVDAGITVSAFGFGVEGPDSAEIGYLLDHYWYIFGQPLHIYCGIGFIRKNQSVLVQLFLYPFPDVLANLAIAWAGTLHIGGGFEIFFHLPAGLE